MRFVWMLCLIASPAAAGPYDVHATAQQVFDRMPEVEETAQFGEICGMGRNSNPHIAYCTTRNRIYVPLGFGDGAMDAYNMAHVLGHAVQVQHGVADIAFREISRRRDEETALRGMVTRQVGCVAGVLMALAGEPRTPLRDLADEPFTDAYWGRNPLNSGPRVSIGIEPRAVWYDIGFDARDFAACTVGEMSADLIVRAQR